MEVLNLTDFFKLFIAFCARIISQLDKLRFDLFGHDVSYVAVIVVFFIMGFIINIFWKGAKT